MTLDGDYFNKDDDDKEDDEIKESNDKDVFGARTEHSRRNKHK